MAIERRRASSRHRRAPRARTRAPNVATTRPAAAAEHPVPGLDARPRARPQGNFALESAIDELAYELGIDPLELRLRNYADVHPQSGLPWSSNALRECYQVGRRAVRLVATAIPSRLDARRPLAGRLRAWPDVSYSWWQVRCQARATDHRDGHALRPQRRHRHRHRHVHGDDASSPRELLGLPLDQVASTSATPTCPGAAVRRLRAHRVARQRRPRRVRSARAAIPRPVADDAGSPLRGCSLDDVTRRGRAHPAPRRPARGESLHRHPRPARADELTADGRGARRPARSSASWRRQAPFAAKFVEVRVDQDLGLSGSRASSRPSTAAASSTRRRPAARSSAAPSAASAWRCSRRPSPTPAPGGSPTPPSATT